MNQYKCKSLCSYHKEYDRDCTLCNLTPEDIFPDYPEKLAQAKASGLCVCGKCDFTYYKNAQTCPKCGEK